MIKWTKKKIEELERDYFPGLDPAQLALHLFNNTCQNAIRSVCNKLSELGLRNKKGYDI